MFAILIFVDYLFRFRIVCEYYQRVKLVLLLLFSVSVHCRPLEMPPRDHTRPPADDTWNQRDCAGTRCF